MMNEMQLTEIRNYLLDKKLPIDILMEVQDHFVSQISDFDKEEKMTFEEAFQKTKNSWQDELKPYWDGGWDLLDKNDITRKFEKSLMWTTVKNSLKISLLIAVPLLLSALFLEANYYKYSFLIVVLAVILLPIVTLIQYFRTLRLFRKYDNYILTLYQSFSFINLSCGYFLYLTIVNFDKGALSFKNLVSGSFDWIDCAIFAFYLLSFVISFFALISQKEYLKRMEKVKPFLKYLKTSS